VRVLYAEGLHQSLEKGDGRLFLMRRFSESDSKIVATLITIKTGHGGMRTRRMVIVTALAIASPFSLAGLLCLAKDKPLHDSSS